MDALEHYCIQLDFIGRKMRLLNAEEADKRNWGKAFPILPMNADEAVFTVGENRQALAHCVSGYWEHTK